MNEALRDAIGRASYEAALGDDMELTWDELSEDAKEVNRRSAEAAVEAYKRATPLKVSAVRIRSILDE